MSDEDLAPNLLKRCRDLRRLAENAATPGEAQAAAFALARTMRRHRLEEADLEETDDTDEPYITEVAFAAGRVLRWRRNLIAVCADMHAVASVLHRAQVDGPDAARLGLDVDRRSPLIRNVQIYSLFGPRRDVHRAKVMYEWLRDTIELAAAAFDGKDKANFKLGFVFGLNDQLEEMMRRERDEVPERALAVLDDQRSAIKAELERRQVRSARKPRPVRADIEALRCGRRLGQVHSLAANVLPTDTGQESVTASHQQLPLETP